MDACHQAAIERPNRVVKCWRDFTESPPIFSPHVALILIPLRLDLLSHNGDQIRPLLSLFQRHLSEGDHIPIMFLPRIRINFLAAYIREDSLRILGTLVDELYRLVRCEYKPLAVDLRSKKT